MPLREEFRAQGNWLFRHRGQLPVLVLLLLPLVIWGGVVEGLVARDERWWQFLCLGVSLLGLLVRMVAVGGRAPGTSGRNTGKQKAKDLNTTGIYATVRHPLYVGNYLMFLGVLLFVGAWWFALVGSLLFWLYYERIMYAEEEFLRETYGERYTDWASETPAFVPHLWKWKKLANRFSLRTCLRNENTSILGLAATLAAVDTLLSSLPTMRFRYDPLWAAVLGGTLVYYLVMRLLAKHTRILKG